MSKAHENFDKIKPPVFLKNEKICVTDIEEKDKKPYFDLYVDEEINRYWGYDYKTDLKTQLTEDYFYCFQKELKEKKEEYTFAIRKDGRYVGEIVLYNFDDDDYAEIGFRLCKNCSGKGYAFESVKLVLEYCKNVLRLKGIKARSFKQNKKSVNLLNRLSFVKISETQRKNYYVLNF